MAKAEAPSFGDDARLLARLLRDHWGRSVTGGFAVGALGIVTAVVAVLGALSNWGIAPTIVSGGVTLAWAAISLPVAFLKEWHTVRGQAQTAQRDLALERDRRPKLVPQILEAVDRSEGDPNSWLVLLNVQVENDGPEQAQLADCEVSCKYGDAEYEGKSYVMPHESVKYLMRNGRPIIVSKTELLEAQGPVVGRGRINGRLFAMFYDAPYENFSDVTLRIRVKGIGCDWSDWTEFRPP